MENYYQTNLCVFKLSEHLAARFKIFLVFVLMKKTIINLLNLVGVTLIRRHWHDMC